MPTAGELGEFALIERITAGLPTSPAVVLGPGDDCAVFGVDGSVAISTDTMVQGRHWRDHWSSARDVGRKAVAAAVADLEAVGARPVALVLALSLPPATPAEWVEELSGSGRQSCCSGVTRRQPTRWC
jgi:thiamine-monophosphate kinase